MAQLGRIITAMATPMDQQGEVDYAQAKRLALALLATGSDGLVISGTTGESPTLTKSEKVRLFEEIVAASRGKGSVLAGTGSYSTRESIELSKRAEAAGVDGLLLVVPYYNKPTQEGLYRHFRAIAEATSLPCMLYNVPSRTVASLSPETTLRLAEVPNIVGVKEASGHLENIAAIVEGAPADFKVWSGNDSDTLPILAIGGYGVVSVASHLVGNQIKQMFESFDRGDNTRAAATHRRLLPLINALFMITSPIPLKFLLNEHGFPVGPCRLPLCEADDATAAKLRAILAKFEIDLPNLVA